MTQALGLLHTYYFSDLSCDEPTSSPTHKKKLSRSAKVNLIQPNFPDVRSCSELQTATLMQP